MDTPRDEQLSKGNELQSYAMELSRKAWDGKGTEQRIDATGSMAAEVISNEGQCNGCAQNGEAVLRNREDTLVMAME